MSSAQKLFISGLSGNLTENNIENYFKQKLHLNVKCSIPKHPSHKGYNQGFGILIAEDSETKRKLLENKSYTIGKRSINVMDYLISKELYQQKQNLSKRRIFVSCKRLNTLNLKTVFSTVGEVVDAFAIRDLKTKKVLTYGYVLFKDIASVEKVLQKDTFMYEGIELNVSPYKKPGKEDDKEKTQRKTKVQRPSASNAPKCINSTVLISSADQNKEDIGALETENKAEIKKVPENSNENCLKGFLLIPPTSSEHFDRPAEFLGDHTFTNVQLRQRVRITQPRFSHLIFPYTWNMWFN